MRFTDFIREHIAVFDGAFGTMLQQRAGGPVGTVPERWNIERPDVIEGIHRDYALAGADVITANTSVRTNLRRTGGKRRRRSSARAWRSQKKLRRASTSRWTSARRAGCSRRWGASPSTRRTTPLRGRR